MARGRLGLLLALGTAAVVAEVAVVVLRPRETPLAPAPVSARSYFSEAQIDRARDFDGPEVALYLATLAIEGAVLVLVARRPPRRLREATKRPLAAAALTGVGIVVALTVATLPLAAVSRQRAVDVGLVTQSWAGWAADVGRSTAIDALLAALGFVVLLALQRRFRRAWWVPGAVLVVAAGVAFAYAQPVVLDPLFNRFTPLPAGRTRGDVLELARRARVDVGQVYEVDASRRSTAANAYVTGIGHTKRVVLYDTLLQHFSRDEIRLVVAHELGHVRHRDVPRGLLYLLLIAPAGLYAARRLGEAVAPSDVGPATPALLPATALGLAVVSLGLTTISNQLSRRVEAAADQFSLELTHAPRPFIAFQRRIALRNVAEPEPPAWRTALLATHPPTLDRIGTAVTFSRRRDGRTRGGS